MKPLLLACALAVLLNSCATSRTTMPVIDLASHQWASEGLRDHPLVGRVWDVKGQRWTSARELEKQLSRADFVLLGETHDNLDDHDLEAKLVGALARHDGAPRTLAFEMLSTDQQAAVDRSLTSHPGDADALAAAVDWSHSGWPPFAEYRPVFEAGLRQHLKIVAADLSDDKARAVMQHGREALDARANALLGPLPTKLDDEWQKEMAEFHCGALPARYLEPMVLAQRARDLTLATTLARTAGKGGAILVTGAGHARIDRGVPALLSKLAPGRAVASVAFLEVRPDASTVEAYGDLPYDFVVFTPVAAREDPCRIFREHAPH